MTDLISRSRLAGLGVIVALALNACAGSDEPVEACHDTPNRESNCSQYSGAWEPEWKEDAAALPAVPRGEDLVPIDAPNGGAGYSYAIDRATVATGEDGVVRYTVMARSGTGVVNIFREGLRCLTTEMRTYAYATSDSDKFRPLANDWSPLATEGVRGYQGYLYTSIMCDSNGYARAEDEVLDALTIQYTAGGIRIERYCGDMQDCNTTGIRY